jgi:hypothetical protein
MTIHSYKKIGMRHSVSPVSFFFWSVFKMIITAVGIGCGQLYFKKTLSPAVQFLAQLCIIRTLFNLTYLLVALVSSI